MTPRLHPQLVNTPFGDPAVYVDFLFERRAFLFDLGEVSTLPARKLLRLTHIFISHTHIDHFIGFDHLLRLFLGRDKQLHLTGPPGFVGQVASRLSAYTWNLVDSYPTDFVIVASELHPDGSGLTASFHSRERFVSRPVTQVSGPAGLALAEPGLVVQATFLDHKIPCLAYALSERLHVNVLKNKLGEVGLPVGAWLQDLKEAIVSGAGDDSVIRAWWREGDEIVERSLQLGELRQQVVTVTTGQKIAYVTDTAFTPENQQRIVALARGADYLFIEATFLAADTVRAAERCHLTARQSGELARAAGVARLVPFHFSPRYLGQADELYQELAEAFGEEGIVLTH